MTVPLVDVAWQHRQVRAEIQRGLELLLADPSCDGVEFIQSLETDFARRLGPGVYAVSTQSGLAAEFLILKALGIGPGDQVLTVPNSDLATSAAIGHTGAQPVFVDIDPRTYTMNPERIEAAITPRTRAIVPVHLYGLPAEMDAIREIAQRHRLQVIEDASLALGAEYRGQPAGALGEAAFFSFAPRKVLGGVGNGGMVTTRDPDLAYRVRLLRGYGMAPEQGERPIRERHTFAGMEHLVEGYNLRLDSVQALVVGAKLARLDEWRRLRQRAADRYAERLRGVEGIELPYVPSNRRHAWRNYVIQTPHRNQVQARMLEKGITTAVFYTPPVHLQPVYRHLGLGPGSFLAAEAAARALLCLPMYPGLTEEQVDQVAGALAETVEEVN